MGAGIQHAVMKAKKEIGISPLDAEILCNDLALELVQKIIRLLRSRLRRKVAVAKKKLIEKKK